jgi:hypothetical protein
LGVFVYFQSNIILSIYHSLHFETAYLVTALQQLVQAKISSGDFGAALVEF